MNPGKSPSVAAGTFCELLSLPGFHWERLGSIIVFFQCYYMLTLLVLLVTNGYVETVT